MSSDTKQKLAVYIVPADRPTLALTRKMINKYLAKIERKNSLPNLNDSISSQNKAFNS